MRMLHTINNDISKFYYAVQVLVNGLHYLRWAAVQSEK